MGRELIRPLVPGTEGRGRAAEGPWRSDEKRGAVLPAGVPGLGLLVGTLLVMDYNMAASVAFAETGGRADSAKVGHILVGSRHHCAPYVGFFWRQALSDCGHDEGATAVVSGARHYAIPNMSALAFCRLTVRTPVRGSENLS